MKIVIETIRHEKQRYPTTGDWQLLDCGRTLLISVSEMFDWRYEMLVGLHEAVEALLCYQRGINEKDVSDFDIEFEKARENAWDDGKFRFRGRAVDVDAEPGDEEDAPYYSEHQIATGIERILAAELDVSWQDYERENLALYEAPK